MVEKDNFERDDDRKLDEMLDTMLSEYSAAEPRPGLETRVLSQVKEESERHSYGRKLRWMWATAALASVAAILMSIYFSRPPSRPGTPEIAIEPQKQEMPAAVQPKETPKLAADAANSSIPRNRTPVVRVKHSSRTELAVVKQDVFPSPSPLSEQEKLLFRYLSRTPKQELIAQSRPDPPSDDTDEDAQEPRLLNLIQVPQRNSNTR